MTSILISDHRESTAGTGNGQMRLSNPALVKPAMPCCTGLPDTGTRLNPQEPLQELIKAYPNATIH